jgi:hypothetical protein
MTTYWLTFRIHNAAVGGRSYEQRYEALNETIRTNCSKWWKEPTSFIAFESNSTISALIAKCKAAIAPSHDLALIRAMDTKSAMVCGIVKDQDIFALMPYLKKS